MSTLAIAKKDFQDGARSKTLWGLTVLFVLFAGGITYAYSSFDLFAGNEEASALGLIGIIQSAGAVLVPIIALLVGYKSIAGERESGSIKLLLGLPHERRDMVFGKLIGRTLVVAVPIVVGYLVAAVLAIVLIGTLPFVDFLLFVGLTVLFGLAYMSVAVGFSSATSSTSRAAALALAVWVIFQIAWSLVTTVILYFANGQSLPARFPDWYYLLNRLGPDGGYGVATGLLLPDTNTALDRSAWFLQEWFGLVILAFWILVPVGLGYLRFRTVDL